MKIVLDLTEIVRLYFEQQLSLFEVGQRMECSQGMIRKKLIEAGYSLRKPGVRKGQSRFMDADVDEMEWLYFHEKRACPEIAELFNCSAGTVRALLRSRGVRLRSAKEAQSLRRKVERSGHPDVERIFEMLTLEKKSTDEISELYGISKADIYNLLKSAGKL